jgi:glycosyltransferase involved in cell wall biosynthesis
VAGPAAGSYHDGSATVGYFGFVNTAKGVDTLLEAFAHARRARPSLRLTMICGLRPDDPYHRQIQELLNSAELKDAVTVTGELDDRAAAETLASCDMVVLPFRDGISLRRTTLMAALTLGCPVISTTARVLPASLQDGRDVVLVPPEDVEALARAIVGLADDPERRAALAVHGRAAAQQFTWPSIAERTEDVYRQALA